MNFLAEPDVYLVGPEILFQGGNAFRDLRVRYQQIPCIAWIPEHKDDISTCDQLANQGCADIFSEASDPLHFFRRLLFLLRSKKREKSGKLVLCDGGKGGVGVTSVVAGLGESLTEKGKSVVLVDGDFSTQSLSRFLHARPFVNENMQLLMEQLRPLSDESVEQCLSPIWESSQKAWCVPPPPDGDMYAAPSAPMMRSFLGFLEGLGELYDYVIVDMARLHGLMQHSLYRSSDAVFFILSPDPSGFYASLEKLQRCRSFLGPGTELRVVVNDSASWSGLSLSSLRSEFLSLSGLADSAWCDVPLRYVKNACFWPGSGQTLASLGGAPLRKSFLALLEVLGVEADPPSLLHVVHKKLFAPRIESAASAEAHPTPTVPEVSEPRQLPFSPRFDEYRQRLSKARSEFGEKQPMSEVA
jgi:hypothetical protein